MTKTEKLYKKISEEKINVYDYKMPKNTKAATIEYNGYYGIYLDKTQIIDSDEEFCVAAHEYGHCKSGATHYIGADSNTIRRNEFRANRQAIIEFLPIDMLIDGFSKGYSRLYELAEYLDLPEKFVQLAIYHYKAMSMI